MRTSSSRNNFASRGGGAAADGGAFVDGPIETMGYIIYTDFPIKFNDENVEM